MPLLTDFVRKKKKDYFFSAVPKDAVILEIGSGGGWVGEYLKGSGYKNYIGMDLMGPADVVGSIKDLQSLPFHAGQFDVIIAFEVIEHVDLVKECHYLLKDSGLLMLTTPVPEMDWMCHTLEKIGLFQKRTSPHDNLTHIEKLDGFAVLKFNIVNFLGQWGIYKKIGNAA
jgi:2-polyprenyl-3-methyl-5-hydroxy-6-metoxy-1,4-benzoquinol methylase